MNIETTRLKIVPLTVEQFHLLLCDINKMEQELDLIPSNELLDKHTQQAMEGLYKEAVKHPQSYIWYTNWQIILKSENKAIGSACFTGEPDKNGQVEIGYGINKDYRNCGYMTEAAEAMCAWAFKQENVKSIIAETEPDNYASHKVLQKCKMEKYLESNNSFWWKIEKEKYENNINKRKF